MIFFDAFVFFAVRRGYGFAFLNFLQLVRSFAPSFNRVCVS